MSNSGSFIVAVDTSSPRASLAIAQDGRLVALFGIESDAPQSAELWENLDMLLARTGATVRDITAVAVTRGPGTFTGVRVGLTAAAGLAKALARPIYGATTLELTARSSGACSNVWALLSAHRAEVYAQPFAVSDEGVVSALASPVVTKPVALFDRLGDGPVRVVGEGVTAFASLLDEAAIARSIHVSRPRVAVSVASGWQVAPAPVFLAGELALAASVWEAEGVAGEDLVEPCYVRPSEAEVNLKLGKLGRPGGTEAG